MIKGLNLPKLIYSASSEYNPKIEVYQVGDDYRLSVNGTVQSASKGTQSVGNRYWGKMVEMITEENPEVRKILLLGLGGATMIHLINEQLPDARVLAVEIDEEMVKVAEKFFGLGDLKNLEIIIDDAFLVVTEPEKYDIDPYSFDAILVDVFCGNKYPELGSSGSFFANVKNLLRPGGMVIFNRIYLGDHQYEADEFVEAVEMNFERVRTEAVAGRSNADNLLVLGRVEGRTRIEDMESLSSEFSKDDEVYNVSNDPIGRVSTSVIPETPVNPSE